MREDLFCYALGELDEEQCRAIEAELATSPELRAELDEIQRCLQDMEADEKLSGCPDGLADRTAHSVMTCGETTAAAGSSAAATASTGCGWFGRRTPITLVDSMVAVGVMMVMASLVLPALNASRNMSRRVACQNHMRELAVYIKQFANDNDGYFPVIDPDENAGSFAMQLTAANYTNREVLNEILACPGGRANARSECGSKALPVYVPTQEELAEADATREAQLRAQMSGDMAYRVGYVRNGVYYPVRDNQDCRMALFGDAPRLSPDGYHSTNHSGGQNVCWEDGSVQFLDTSVVPGVNDHLYLNRSGLPAAGIGWCDAVLSPSHATPGVARETKPHRVVILFRFKFRSTSDLPTKIQIIDRGGQLESIEQPSHRPTKVVPATDVRQPSAN